MRTYSHPDYPNLHIVDNCPTIVHPHTGVEYPVTTYSQLIRARHTDELYDDVYTDTITDEYRYRASYPAYEPLQSTDIQCIIGARILRNTDRTVHGYTYKPIPRTRCYNYQRRIISNGWYGHDYRYVHKGRDNDLRQIEYDPVLSVVYITKQDGLINHDIYFRWCKETGLPFPEDLIHTPISHDRALSNVRSVSVGTKSSYDELGLIDSIRKKRTFMWALPFIKDGIRNIDYSDIKVFNRIPKSSYNRAWTISTYTKLAERRNKRARDRRKQIRKV